MGRLTETRKRFRGTAIALGIVALLSGLYLVLPVGATRSERAQELLQRQREVRQQEEQARPLRAMPQLLLRSQKDIAAFYQERLASRFSTVTEQIGKLAAKNHVALAEVRYETLDTELPQLQVVQIDAALAGEYQNVARFINSVERSKLFFLVDGLELAEQRGGAVKLQLKMETYLRPASPGDYLTQPAKQDDPDKNGDEEYPPAKEPGGTTESE